MTFNEYQKLTAETAIYPGKGGTMGLAYVGLGLGESGEVQGKIKKIIRDDYGIVTEEKAEAIAKELGDLLWYISETATAIGVTLDFIAIQNIYKLKKRKEDGTLQGSGDHR